MDWSMKKNLNYLLLLLGLCCLIPHGILFLLGIPSVSNHLAPAQIEFYSDFFVFQWTPFWAAYIAYLRLQKKETFSLLPSVGFALILTTFLPGFQLKSVLVLGWMIPLMLVMESTALLKKLESSENRVLSGIAADRQLLRAFYFWSLGFLLLVYISCEAQTVGLQAGESLIISPFLMAPVSVMLTGVIFRCQKDRLPGLWTLLGMLAMIPVSLYLASGGPMEQYKRFHLGCLVNGYVLLFLMLILCGIGHWKRQKTAS